MSVKDWSMSTVGYGRKLVQSTVSGVRNGQEQFRENGQLSPYFERSVRQSLGPAALGAIVGACIGFTKDDRRSIGKMLVGGILGGLVGFGASMLWETRDLSRNVGSSVRKNVQLTRDEHWLQRHPIDYA